MKASMPPPGWPAARKHAPLISHAGATRSQHFQALVDDGTAWKLGGAALVAAFLFGALERDMGAFVFALVAAPVVTVLTLMGMANWRAQVDFFKSYSTARGLTYSEKGELVPLTPLLGAGDRRRAAHVMKGTLPSCQRQGTLALFTYEVRKTMSPGTRNDDYESHHFTVCLLDVGRSFPLFKGMYLSPRGRGFEADDWTRGGGRREIELESVEFNRAYRLRISGEQEPGVVRELFAPALIVRLIERPLHVGFELSAGTLCVFAPRRIDDAAGLDRFLDVAAELLGHVEREVAERALAGA